MCWQCGRSEHPLLCRRLLVDCEKVGAEAARELGLVQEVRILTL